MKASVITLHSVCNYGTQLQALATQEKLKEYFDEVEFVNYRRPNTYGIKLMKTFSGKNPLKMLAIMPTLIKWKSVFGNFQSKYLNISKDDYHKINSDIYFSGSDQVWNTGWNNGIIPEMYLEFVPDDIPKYSYSSSFGLKELNSKDKVEVKKYLSRYSKITVREDSAVEILKDLGITNVERILDPTLVMDKEFWRSIAPKNKIKGDYILIYNLNRSEEFDKYCEEFAKKTGLKLYRFCTRYDQIFRNGKSLLIPEILEFITLIDDAKYVITDSFHATAFSVNMNTIPVSIYPKEYSSRLSDFLKLVDMEECHPANYNDFSIITKNIKFDDANKILDIERKKVDNYLRSIKDENRLN
nr:polysaccharide pyruvyl transferase family protein [Bacilli bacterium]